MKKKIFKTLIIISIIFSEIMINSLKASAIETGWVNENNQWKYYENRIVKTGWFKYGQDWYYSDNNGFMKTGWVYINNNWYYLKDDGAMITEWKQMGNQWYYLNYDGSMAKGWVKNSGTWYYLKSDGAMARGWLNCNGNWYYLNNNGSMAYNRIIDNKFKINSVGCWDGKTINYKTYFNDRYKFQLKYPDTWTDFIWPENCSGFTFYDNNKDNRFGTFGIHNIYELSFDEIAEDEKNCFANATISDFITDSGDYGKLIEGQDGDKHVSDFMILKEGIIYVFYCNSTYEYYYQNKDLINYMLKSFEILPGEKN